MKKALYFVFFLILFSCSKHDIEYKEHYQQVLGKWRLIGVENTTQRTCPNISDTSYFAPYSGDVTFNFEKHYIFKYYVDGAEKSKSKTDFYEIVGDPIDFTFRMKNDEFDGTYHYKDDTIKSELQLTYTNEEYCFAGINEYGEIIVHNRKIFVRN